MKGIELSLNNKKTTASIASGSLHVIIGQKVEENGESSFTLNFSALNTATNEFIDWSQTELAVGDKLVIELKEVEINSEPIQLREANLPKAKIPSKLDTYHQLKKELEKEGLI